MATKDMERVSHLEGAYEHMATKAELATLDGDYRVEFTRMNHTFDLIERRFESIDRRFEEIDRRFEEIDQRFEAIDRRFEAVEATMRSMQEVLVQILERLDRLESLNTRALGFQTQSRTLRDDGDDF